MSFPVAPATSRVLTLRQVDAHRAKFGKVELSPVFPLLTSPFRLYLVGWFISPFEHVLMGICSSDGKRKDRAF